MLVWAFKVHIWGQLRGTSLVRPILGENLTRHARAVRAAWRFSCLALPSSKCGTGGLSLLRGHFGRCVKANPLQINTSEKSARRARGANTPPLQRLHTKGVSTHARALGFQKDGWSCGYESIYDEVAGHQESLEGIAVILTPLPKRFIKEALRITNADRSVRVPGTFPENGWEGEVSF